MKLPPAWAEIDLTAITHNLKLIRSLTGSEPAIMAVVKADGYGHGAVKVSRVSLAGGANWLGVARLEEALELRQAGLDAPMLVFGYIDPRDVGLAAGNKVTATVQDPETARELSAQACRQGVRLPFHLKVDTGMGRLGLCVDPATLNSGVTLEDRIQQALDIAALPGLRPTGVYTHFASADDPDLTWAKLQLEAFMGFLDGLKRSGFDPGLTHTSGSAGIMVLPEAHLDMVRPGIMLYGLWPDPSLERLNLDLRPALTLKATIAQVKDVPAGFRVSYGCTYQTPAPARLATVTLGYADGYSRGHSNKGEMLVHGQRARIVGRVCMDQTILDVSDIDGIRPGDEVVALGRQGGEMIRIEDAAQSLGTIPHEMVTPLTSRVRRIYPR